MAQHWQGKLIAVIVSGFDGDGADALCEIQDVGGVTIAQRLYTAGEPDMPASAIASGCIDYILAPENIPATIRQLTLASSSGHPMQKPRIRIEANLRHPPLGTTPST
jgi:chemotaxis response regulator CheB